MSAFTTLGRALRKQNEETETKRSTSLALITLQHVVLWASLLALVVGIALLVKTGHSVDPTGILVVVSASTSIIYVLSHNLVSFRLLRGESTGLPKGLKFKQPRYLAGRLTGLICLLWLASSGWGLTMAARRPVCLAFDSGASWDAGSPCVLERTGTALSVFLLATCCGLFTLIQMSHNPFHNHLFGRIDPDAILVESNTAPYSFVSYSDKINGSLHSHSNSFNSIETPATRESPPSAGAVPPPEMRQYALPINTPVGPHPFAGHPLAISRPDVGGSGTRPIYRSASHSNLTVPQRPIPLRRAPSAPSLTPTSAGQQRAVAHQRSWSASSAYPLYRSLSHASLARPLTPMAASGAFGDLSGRVPASVYRQQMRLASPSAWRAVHPPAHHFRHASAAPPRLPTTPTTFSTIRSLPQFQLHRQYSAGGGGGSLGRARTAASASASASSLVGSGGAAMPGPYAASWAHFPARPPPSAGGGGSVGAAGLHRAGSSHGSSGSGRGVGGSLTGTPLHDHAEVDEGEEEEDEAGSGSESAPPSSFSSSLAPAESAPSLEDVRRPAAAGANKLRKARHQTGALNSPEWKGKGRAVDV